MISTVTASQRHADRRGGALLAACLAASFASPAAAGEWSGDVGVETRYFPSDPLDPVQHEANVSVYAAPEFYHDWDDGNQRFVFAPFVRADAGDGERSHFDLREFYWRRSFDNGELIVGLQKVYWGVTESAHLVDLINQSDTVENLDSEDKLGQPMVNLRLLRDWGTVDLFLLPYFRERTFPGARGRLRTPFPIDASDPAYESGAEERHVDLAARWSHFMGDWDIGVSAFHGTGREPDLLPVVGPGGLVLRPAYPQISQVSLDLQATLGSWLWKLEAFHRTGQGESFQALAGGFEYTRVGLFGSPVDLGVITEYLHDNRTGSASVFDDDLALGFRLAFNDVQSTQVLAFSGIDLDSRGSFTSVEGSRRLGQSWTLSLEARFFSNADPDEVLFSLRDDDYVELSLARFF